MARYTKFDPSKTVLVDFDIYCGRAADLNYSRHKSFVNKTLLLN